MNYDEIKALALSYADREDQDVIDRMPLFFSMTEAQINKSIDVDKAYHRARMAMVEGQEYYALPTDFNGLRDIEISSPEPPNSRSTPQYLSPEQFNNSMSDGSTASYYTILADQIQISPSTAGCYIEIVYSQALAPLTPDNAENWLSISDPDVYVFGILVEISAYTKDGQAAGAWKDRFNSSVDIMNHKDKIDRWSGTTLQIRVEDF